MDIQNISFISYILSLCNIYIKTNFIVSIITLGTKNSIIIKDWEYFEELSKIKAIMSDKTRNLTEGNLEIVNISPINYFKEDKIIKIVCSLENNSKHLISKVFNDYRRNNNIELFEIDNFKSTV